MALMESNIEIQENDLVSVLWHDLSRIYAKVEGFYDGYAEAVTFAC